MPRLAAELTLLIVAGCGRSHFDPCGPAGAADGAVPDADDLSRGLEAHYTFDLPDPDLLDDVAGSHDANCTACPLQAGGLIGAGALNFAGGQCVMIPDTVELRPTSFTISLWMNAGAQTGSVFSRPLNGATGISNSIHLFYDTNLTQLDGEVAGIVTSSTVSPGWNHIALRYDGATVTLYVGGFYRSDATAGGIAYGANDTHLIGCDIDAGSVVSGFVGSVDDLRIYDRALDQAEITALAAR